MKISETTYTVNKNGSLKIPSEAIQQMGLYPGSHVRVAYLTQDGEKNTFQEFLFSAHGIEKIESDDGMIKIPDTLLERSNLSGNTAVQIICLDGCIIICRDDQMSLEELSAVLDGLNASNELTEQLSTDFQMAQEQLADLTEDLDERSRYEL